MSYITDTGAITEDQMMPARPEKVDVKSDRQAIKDQIQESIDLVINMKFNTHEEVNFQNGVVRGLRMALKMV